MTKLSKNDLAVLIACGVFWLGSIVAMCFIKHWAVVFVALLHCASIWFALIIGDKYIPTKQQKTQIEKERELAEKNADESVRRERIDKMIMWDIIDEG